MAGHNAGTTERERCGAVETLAQLGWQDNQTRLLTLRLTDPQWQTVQQAVLEASAEAPGRTTTEQLLAACLQQWLAGRGAGAVDPRAFVPREPEAADGKDRLEHAFAGLNRWLGAFGDKALFTVVLLRARSDGGVLNRSERDENFRQVSAEGVRRMVARYGARVRSVQHEDLPASAWTEAIDRFGTCD